MHLTSNKRLRNLQQSELRDEAYSAPCPYCGAAPGENCRSGGKVYWSVHRSRRPRPELKSIPECVSWWKAQKIYEGQYAAPRPANYRVPSNAEIIRQAGAA